MGATKAGTSRKKGAAAKENTKPAALPVLSFTNASAWAKWLASHHQSSRGLWMKIAKKGGGTSSVTYPEALEVALAWGWIDGQKDKCDESWWLQRFSPRGPRSIWSKINCEKAMAMVATGQMEPAGLAEIERAKKDGRWEAAYPSQSRSGVPADLAVALEANPRAARFFESLESYNRYAVLFRIHTAKKAETRSKRIEKFVAMLARHEKVHP